MLDLAVDDVYGEGAARWSLHDHEPISDNLLRRVAARAGAPCEAADQGRCGRRDLDQCAGTASN